MSNRYGRKQLAARRIKIAELMTRLSRESTVNLYLPGVGVPELESVARVIDWRVSEEGSEYGMVERHGYLTVLAPSQKLLDMMHNRTTVQYKGTKYIIASGSYQVGMECERVELELMGVA